MNRRDTAHRTTTLNLRRDHRNVLIHHTGNETLDHWLTKALTAWQIRRLGYTYYSEHTIGDARADLFCLENNMVYEIETNPTPASALKKCEQYKYVSDVIQLCPRDFAFRFSELKRQIGRKVI